MKTPRKHAELIKAWADGAEIQCCDPKLIEDIWVDCIPRPSWHEGMKYRIKPEPKPDVVRFVTYEWNPINERTYGGVPDQKQDRYSNLKLTFDGETGKLKSAEVL